MLAMTTATKISLRKKDGADHFEVWPFWRFYLSVVLLAVLLAFGAREGEEVCLILITDTPGRQSSGKRLNSARIAESLSAEKIFVRRAERANYRVLRL